MRPPVSHRPPLFCQDRRDPLVGYARQFNTPAAAAQTGEPGVVHHPRRTRAPCQRPASPVSGGRGKADCGTQAERMWSRGPAGSVTRRRFACFAAGGKVGRPAGRNPSEAETVGWKEDPSSVTAYAVTPSPLWGEGFSGGWKPPLRGPLRSLRRGAQSAPAVSHRPFHRAHRPPVENFLGSEESPGKPCGFPGPCF